MSTPFGPAWEVWVDGADPMPPTPVGGRGRHADPTLLEALRLVERLQADHRTAEERYQQQLMELAGRVGYLQAELTQARDTIKMLEAPKEPPPCPSPDEAELGEPPHGWWGRVLARIYG
jgi:hypothetical protein